MNTEKLKVAIVFGGRSTEHQISLQSAQNVLNSLDREKYEPLLIGIDKQGLWQLHGNVMQLNNPSVPNKISLKDVKNPIVLSQNTNTKSIISLDGRDEMNKADIIFPVLHGTFGEDGSIQGLAKLANIPCVGCGILGSAVGMDKDIMKHILRSSNIKVAKWVTIRNNVENADYNAIEKELGNELFIKPANLGSSVGVSYTTNAQEFHEALTSALKYDHKVIIEEKIVGREIECAVLGNDRPEASIPGEVKAKGGFYSYENKYLDEKGAELLIPADLTKEQIKRVQQLSLATYSQLECRGMTRVDMFLTENEELIINEVNTIPGFTNISMYPKLWEISGLPQQDLITKLIELAIEEHEKENQLDLS